VIRPCRMLLRAYGSDGHRVRSIASSRGNIVRPKKTILCVDDNEQSLSIRKFMLETRGYSVITCTNGQDALLAFTRKGADLVLTDLMMPGVDGADLVQKIKAISPETPAIIFSGKIKMYDKEMLADLFLPKGMHAPAELLERIRLLLVRKRGPKKSPKSVTVAVGAPKSEAS
jgi:two-component system, OmpR family, response regulator CpxR